MFHYQTSENDHGDALSRLPPGTSIKAVSDISLLEQAQQFNPDSHRVFRYHHDEHQWFSTDLEDMRNKWRTIFPMFVDETFLRHAANGVVHEVEEHNEYLSTGMSEQLIQERLVSAQAAADVWNNEFRTGFDDVLANIRLVLCNTAVGNNIPWQFAQLAIDEGCILGYHPYTHWLNGERHDADWPYLSGRHELMELFWEANHDIDVSKILWLFTEAGPYASTWDGWRASNCLGNDANKLVEAMRLWIRDLATTNAYITGRILGFHMFTVYRGGWDKFQLRQPEMNMLADMYAQEWNPGTAPSQSFEAELISYARQFHIDHGIHVNPDAGIMKDGISPDGVVALSNEHRVNIQGRQLVIQMAAEDYRGSPEYVYYVDVPHYNIVNRLQTNVSSVPPETDFFDFPIGTAEERASASDDWPGEWEDANPFGNQYTLRDSWAYHTGADLNLNTPHWDADRGKPVVAVANGKVTCARWLSTGWANVVVIEHTMPDGSKVYSRSAHLANMLVREGDIVRRGQQIASVGQDGYNGPFHLHFDISPTGRLLEYPNDWPGQTWSRIERDYVDPLEWIKNN